MDRCDCARGRDYMRFPKITPTWHPPSEAAGERNCNPLRSRALASPHQSARTALALVVGTAASRSCHRLAYLQKARKAAVASAHADARACVGFNHVRHLIAKNEGPVKVSA